MIGVMYTYNYIYIYRDIYIYIHTHIHVYAYVANVHVYIRTCMYIYMYTCLYTHICRMPGAGFTGLQGLKSFWARCQAWNVQSEVEAKGSIWA